MTQDSYIVLTVGTGASRRPRLSFFSTRLSRRQSSLIQILQPRFNQTPSSCKAFLTTSATSFYRPSIEIEAAMVNDTHQICCRILPVDWTRVQFEQRHATIVTYAKNLIGKNFPKGIDVDRDDVIHMWCILVDRVFSKGESARKEYMAQVSYSIHRSYVRG